MEVNIRIEKFGLVFTETVSSLEAIFDGEIDTVRKMPEKCPYCGADVRFEKSKRTAKKGKNSGKSFTYYSLICAGPDRHQSDLGIYDSEKSGKSGMYYKGEWTYYDREKSEQVVLPPPWEYKKNKPVSASNQQPATAKNVKEPNRGQAIKYGYQTGGFKDYDEVTAVYDRIVRDTKRQHGWSELAWNMVRTKWKSACEARSQKQEIFDTPKSGVSAGNKISDKPINTQDMEFSDLP